jgi:hypothetical protein
VPQPVRVALITALTLSLVAATGCGGGNKKSNDYVNAVNKAQTEFAASITKLESSAGSGSQSAEQTFARLKAAIDKVIADLEATDPPAKVKQLHNQLVGEMGQLGVAVGKAADALASRDEKKLAQAQAGFSTGLSQLAARVTNTIAEINAKLRD